MHRRNALMAFSGILATSAFMAVPRRPALAQSVADSGTPNPPDRVRLQGSRR